VLQLQPISVGCHGNISNFHLVSFSILYLYTLKMLGCFDPILGKIWTNPAIGLKI